MNSPGNVLAQYVLFEQLSFSFLGSFFRTRMMVGNLRQMGIMDFVRERLKTIVNTGASWLAYDLNTRPVMPSGLNAFLGFIPFSCHAQ